VYREITREQAGLDAESQALTRLRMVVVAMLHIEQGLSFQDIATRIGMSRSRVQQLVGMYRQRDGAR
jgi:DNA-binding transcriptional regulator LsrR (DeoR family)